MTVWHVYKLLLLLLNQGKEPRGSKVQDPKNQSSSQSLNEFMWCYSNE